MVEAEVAGFEGSVVLLEAAVVVSGTVGVDEESEVEVWSIVELCTLVVEGEEVWLEERGLEEGLGFSVVEGELKAPV